MHPLAHKYQKVMDWICQKDEDGSREDFYKWKFIGDYHPISVLSDLAELESRIEGVDIQTADREEPLNPNLDGNDWLDTHRTNAPYIDLDEALHWLEQLKDGCRELALERTQTDAYNRLLICIEELRDLGYGDR